MLVSQKDQGQGSNMPVCVLSKENLVKRLTCLSAALTREHTTINAFWIMLVLSLPMPESASGNRDKKIDYSASPINFCSFLLIIRNAIPVIERIATIFRY